MNLNFILRNHHNIAFKGKKDEKVRAHIGCKILTSIVQDSQNIHPASNSDSDRVERIVGSSSSSSELNELGDQAADSQQEQEAEDTILETSTSRMENDTSPLRLLCAMA